LDDDQQSCAEPRRHRDPRLRSLAAHCARYRVCLGGALALPLVQPRDVDDVPAAAIAL
jgi:hypothetical protein